MRRPRRSGSNAGHIAYPTSGTIWVVCSRCQRRAQIATRGPVGLGSNFANSGRLICARCGFVEDRLLRIWVATGNPAGRNELWLRAPCMGHTLWALDGAHLCRLQDFVDAHLRERRRSTVWRGVQPEVDRAIPRWLKQRNRRPIQRALRRLHERALQS